MHLRFGLGFALAAALLGAVAVGSGTSAQAQTPNPTQGIPITGTTAGISSFTGTFNIERFAVRGGQVVAVGTLTGTLTNLATNTTQMVDQTILLPVTPAGASCEILHLELGPLDLNLLGLMVHLDRVVLDITAQSGPGNLLGNLLCDVANLLNGRGHAFGRLANLLNQILTQL